MNMASFEAFSFSNYSSDDKGIKTSGLGDILNVIQSNNFLTYLYLTQAGVVSAYLKKLNSKLSLIGEIQQIYFSIMPKILILT